MTEEPQKGWDRFLDVHPDEKIIWIDVLRDKNREVFAALDTSSGYALI